MRSRDSTADSAQFPAKTPAYARKTKMEMTMEMKKMKMRMGVQMKIHCCSSSQTASSL